MSKASDAAAVEFLSKRIGPLLARWPPEIQGAVLADLLSVWIAGHHPSLRENLLAAHIDAVRALVPETEKEIFPNGKPEGW
jgi:hypothetical protein